MKIQEYLELYASEVSLPEIGILDIGAMLVGQERKEYAALIEAGIARVVGFEPIADECKRLDREFTDKKLRFLPYFIGDGTKQTFFQNNYNMTSSLYEPNTGLLNLFNNLAELTTPIKREVVQTTRLDDVQEINFPVDYVKIDIQGAELQAFQGGRRVLMDTVVIQTEVEWVEMYCGQPLFAEIELELRSQGFIMHKIINFGTRAFKPIVINNNTESGLQHLWSDVVFVRDFTRLGRLSERQLLTYLIIMFEIYKAIDMTVLVIDELGKRIGKSLRESYFGWLMNVKGNA